MRVLILSKSGDIASIAYKLSKENHHVDFWIEDREYKTTLDGFVNRPESWRPLMAQADLILSDHADFSKYVDIISRLGKPMIGFNAIGSLLETDRQKQNEALHKVGIKTPAEHTLTTIKDTNELSWDNVAGYIVHMSDMQYKCDTPEMLDWVLNKISSKHNITLTELLPEDGSVKLSIEGWFNGIDWISPFYYILCEHNFSIVIPNEKVNKLIKSTIYRLSPILSQSGYRGPVSIKCLIHNDDVYVLHIRCGFNYKAIPALMTGITEPFGAFLFDVATGIKKQVTLAKNISGFDFLGSVSVRHEYDHAESKGMPIMGLTEQDMKFVYFHDVYKDDNLIRYNGVSPCILYATAFGRSIKEVQHRINKLCKNIKAIGIEYEDDIKDDVDNKLNTLKEGGWL